MLVGELRNKVDRIWEMFWTGGITNPLSVIEQITYLMFIKGLDATEEIREKEAQLLEMPYEPLFPLDKPEMRFSTFKNLSADKMFMIVGQQVFPFIKELGSKAAFAAFMNDALFLFPTAQLLQRVVTAIDEFPLQDKDAMGDLYEYMLGKLSQAGQNGQFRTPRHIIKMMVELTSPGEDEVICDPAMGTAGFLVAASEFIRIHHKEMFFKPEKAKHFHAGTFHGFDMDRTMLRIGAMNMMLHNVDMPLIEYRDSLSEQNAEKGLYSLILANPPFKGSLDYDSVSADLLQVTRTKKTELLFLALFLRMLKVGGRCACIVPDGVLFGSSNAHKALRQELVEKHRLQAVISMPSGVFKPYAGVSTAVLLFTKTGVGGTEDVWFYDMQADGYSLDDKRTLISENDIPDIIARFHHMDAEKERQRTDKSFRVPKSEIVGNEYDLSINKYKKAVYAAEQYPAPKEILDEIKALEAEILKGLDELEGMV